MKFIKKILGIPSEEDMLENVHGATDVGKIRQINEDYFLVNLNRQLYIVSDGMGGHNAGEIASENAAESVNQYFSSQRLSDIQGDTEKIRDEMTTAVKEAHNRIAQMAESKAQYKGMGCTIVAALIVGNDLHLCHVGDSRAYRSTHSGIQLLTTDHSHVMALVKAGKMTMEEARVSPLKNELSQAMGASAKIEPEYTRYSLSHGDTILLCSDGLWDMLSDNEIDEILKRKKPLKTICRELISSANQKGGRDNITVVAIRHEKEETGLEEKNTKISSPKD